MVYLDFSKAFESSSHELLIHKLSSFGFHPDLIHWFRAYLTGRRQRGFVDGIYSDWLPVVSVSRRDPSWVPSSLRYTCILTTCPVLPRILKLPCLLMMLNVFLNISMHMLIGVASGSYPSKCQVISVTRKRKPFNFDYFMNNIRLSSV